MDHTQRTDKGAAAHPPRLSLSPLNFSLPIIESVVKLTRQCNQHSTGCWRLYSTLPRRSLTLARALWPTTPPRLLSQLYGRAHASRRRIHGRSELSSSLATAASPLHVAQLQPRPVSLAQLTAPSPDCLLPIIIPCRRSYQGMAQLSLAAPPHHRFVGIFCGNGNEADTGASKGGLHATKEPSQHTLTHPSAPSPTLAGNIAATRPTNLNTASPLGLLAARKSRRTDDGASGFVGGSKGRRGPCQSTRVITAATTSRAQGRVPLPELLAITPQTTAKRYQSSRGQTTTMRCVADTINRLSH